MAGKLLLNECMHLGDDALAFLVDQHYQVTSLRVELHLLATQFLFVCFFLLGNLSLVATSQLQQEINVSKKN